MAARIRYGASYVFAGMAEWPACQRRKRTAGGRATFDFLSKPGFRQGKTIVAAQHGKRLRFEEAIWMWRFAKDPRCL